MIKVRIGSNEREYSAATETWIHQHVNQRKNDGHQVCALVTVKNAGLDIILSTPACGGGGGGGRRPTADEQELLDLWDKLHLNQQIWSSGNLIAFLKQIKRLA